MDFVHLHNHTDYSMLDGATTVDRLITKVSGMGMPAVAVTDHGNMFCAIEFYKKAKAKGVKPIIGEEFYIAPGSRFSKEGGKGRGGNTSYHLLVLAKNNIGYQNLMKLSSIGYTEGFYYKPRIDFEVLAQHSEGLIVTSACIAGQIPSLIINGHYDEALHLAGQYKDVFGKDNFYLELQYHGIKDQKVANKGLIKMASELDLALIATNDAHYLNKEDAHAHEVLLCAQTGKTMSDPNRMRFDFDEFYVKSGDEMNGIFYDYPHALLNTCQIADMVDVELNLGHPVLPEFEVPEGHDLNSYLRHLVYEGAEKLYGDLLSDAVRERIDYELSVISNMDFPGYFLIVWDFINYAKSQGIPVGPGRGSAAGSIVSYCLGITLLDPLKYNLLFERFLNPDRIEMPDMDLDFCADRREEVIDYVKEKYGHDHVSQIITFNKLKAKAVVKDVARAMDIPFEEANGISKMIEQETLTDSIEFSPDLKKFSMSDEGKELIETSLKLEGLSRSAGKHAAGVVISRGPLTDYVPLYKDKDGSIISQYEKVSLEEAGLVKMDFLGLKNLTIIESCLKLIERGKGEKIDINNIPLDDEETFKLLQRADTKGVFQLESSGMQNVLRRLGPTEFEDIIAIVALYRPGPLKSGMTDDFIDRKKQPDHVQYPHESLKPVLKDTLGVIVYQEQVMLISQIFAGFTLPEADKLRKAMGKKKMDIIDALEEKFLSGAREKGMNLVLAQDLYNSIKKFGEYGFNKSHSAAYALVTYQTAYLKAHYRLEYMVALLSAQPDKQDDVIQYIGDCREMGIEVIPPSVNSGEYDFTIEDGKIRFGFGAIKGMGEKAIENIVKVRNEIGSFSTLKEFLEKIDLSVNNKGVLEAMIKSGALDELHANRAQLFQSLDLILELARQYQKDIETGQGDLFSMGDDGGGSNLEDDLPQVDDWPDKVRLGFEKEVLGLYLSGHPLAKYEKEISAFPSYTIRELTEDKSGKDISIVGVIGDLSIRRAKSGKLYALGKFEDLGGAIELLVFSSTIKKHQDLLESGEPVVISGKVEFEGDRAQKIIVKSIRLLRDMRRESVSGVHIKFDSLGIDDRLISSLKEIVERHRGDCSVFFHVKGPEESSIIRAHSAFNVSPSEGLVKDVSELLGSEALRYSFFMRA